MMHALYYDRDANPVSQQQWQQLSRQPGYGRVGYADTIRHGQQVTVITFWSGIAGGGPDQPLIFCTCAGIRDPGRRRPAYQRLWGWPTIAAARAGHRAVTAWIAEIAGFLAGATSQLPRPTRPCPEVRKMTMTEPRFPVQVIGGVPVVITPQEVDITNAGALRAALLHASAARPGADVVADMTRTWFCDCAGLHALAGAHKRARAEGRQVTLAVTGAPVRRILALTALDRLLPVCTSLDQALARSRARRRQEPADHLLLGAGTTGHTGPPRTAAEAGRVPGSRPGTWLPARTAAGHGELTTPLRLHGGDRP